MVLFTRHRAALLAATAAALAAGLVPATSDAASATRPMRATVKAADTNPLAGATFGVYTGGADGVYPAWQAATGDDKALLARVAKRARVRWFGSWIPTKDIGAKIGDYISSAQDGAPDVVVPLAVFRLWPEGEGAKDKALTDADRAAYKRWVDEAAAAIGSSKVALVLEPDLAVALKGWKPSVRLALANYAAGVFGALPHASVYLDASDWDWLPVDKAVSMLLDAGVRDVRGFALGATHYARTGSNIRFAKQVSDALADQGVPGKHAVLDTADNGRPFTWSQFYAAHPHGDFDNAGVCKTRTQKRCVTLGIPPTSDVDAAAWRISDAVRPIARDYVDAYLWFGRPWLVRQASPFSLARTLGVARTTPYQ